MGIDWTDPTGTGTPSDYTFFHVLENTPEVHNVIVRAVLLLSPARPRYVAGLVPHAALPAPSGALAREVLAEFGLHIPPEVEVRVRDSNHVAVHGDAHAPRGHRGVE